MTDLPHGFGVHVGSIGIKDRSDDFMVLAADHPGAGCRRLHPQPVRGPERHHQPPTRRRPHAAGLRRHRQERQRGHGRAGPSRRPRGGGVGGLRPRHRTRGVLIASTGVIGRPYPMDRVRTHLADLHGPLTGRDAEPAATAMMTTDTVAKVASAALRRRFDRRDGQGRRHDRARHGHAHRPLLHRPRRGARCARCRVPAGDRPHPQRAEHRHRHLDQRHGGGDGERAGRTRRPRPVRDGLGRGGAVVDPPDRPRRRRGHHADRGARRRGP